MSGSMYRPRAFVLAEQAAGERWIATRTGVRPARAGDYIVTHADGTKEVRGAAEFHALYEPLPGSAIDAQCEWPTREALPAGEVEC